MKYTLWARVAPNPQPDYPYGALLSREIISDLQPFPGLAVCCSDYGEHNNNEGTRLVIDWVGIDDDARQITAWVKDIACQPTGEATANEVAAELVYGLTRTGWSRVR